MPQNALLSELSQQDDLVGLDQLERLAELSVSFSSSLNIQETLDEGVVKIASLMRAEAASIFLMDQKKQHLVCRSSFGPVDVRGMELPVNEGVIGRAIEESAPQLVENTLADPDFTGHIDQKTGFQSKSMVCSPLQVGEGVLGVIQVLNRLGGKRFKPSDATALKMLCVPVALAIHNAQMAMHLVEQKRIQRELKIARKMQKSLLPLRKKPPFPILAINLPAQEVSGDFYDYFEMPDGQIRFTIGDVSGKGLDASLLMMRTTSLLHWVGKQGHSPGEWMKQVNEELCESISMGMFVCVVCGEYNPKTGGLSWANAGFLPLLQRMADLSFRQYPAENPPLGIVAQEQYIDHTANLDDTSMHLYSDGVTESRDETGDQLEEAGFRELILEQSENHSPEQQMSRLVYALRQRRITDDTTLMLITDRSRMREPLVELGFTADAENLKMVRDVLRDALESIGADETFIGQMQLAINEASTNILRHAYQGDPGGRIILSLLKRENVLEFVLQDFAPCVNCDAIQPRDLSECRPGGLGINLIDTLMDEWFIQSSSKGIGNCLTMRKRYE